MHRIPTWFAWLVVAGAIALALVIRVWVRPDENWVWIALGIVVFGLGGHLLGSPRDVGEPESSPDPE